MESDLSSSSEDSKKNFEPQEPYFDEDNNSEADLKEIKKLDQADSETENRLNIIKRSLQITKSKDINEKQDEFYLLQFNVIVDKGPEYQIEKILPYEDNLLRICNLLSSKDYKTIGLYGDPTKLGQALGTIFGFQVEPMSLDTIGFGKIAAYIKDRIIIFVMYCPAKIWEQRPLTKDGIYVTLFRILIDISQIVFLLMEDQLFKYFDHKQNHPLKKDAFISTDFVLIKKKHVDVKIQDIKFEESSIIEEFGDNFAKGLILENDFSKIVAYHKTHQIKIKRGEILRNIRDKIQIICAVEQSKRASGLEKFSKLIEILPTQFQEKFNSLLMDTYEEQDKVFQDFEKKVKSFIASCFEASKNYSTFLGWGKKYNVENFELTKSSLLLTMKTKFLQEVKIFEDSKKQHDFKVVVGEDLFKSWIFYELAKNFVGDKKDQKQSDLNLEMQKDEVLQINLKEIISFYEEIWKKIISSFYRSLRDEMDMIKIEQDKIFEISLFSMNSISSSSNDLQNVTLTKYNQENLKIEKHQVLKGTSQEDAELDRILPTKSRNACYLIFKLIGKNDEGCYKLFFLTSNKFLKNMINFSVQNPIFIYNEDKETLLLMDCDNDKIYEYSLTQYGEIKDGIVTECTFSLKEISFATCDFQMENIFLFQNKQIFKFDRTKPNSKPEELLKIKNSADGHIITSKLSPGKKDRYIKMVRFRDPGIFGLQSKKSLDIYDSNYILLERMPVDSNFIIKTFNDKINEYIVIFSSTRRICKVLPGLASDTTFKIQSPNDSANNKLGNPAIDVILFAHLKYGPFNTNVRDDFEGIYFFIPKAISDREMKISQLKKYTKSLPNVCMFRYINEDQIFYQINSMGKSTCSLHTLLSRVPLQLCTIENSNIIPLINGKKQSLSSLTKLKEIHDKAKLIKFGFLETFMNSIDPEAILVFSIVGRQSSGKSYLLNRLFGTKFFVASTRCTDGIWVSYAFIESKHCFIFDCEGLFSVRRNETEETKLITFLSAISDVTILNQDLSFNRYVNKLFSELSQAVDKLKGDDLFKGILMMAVRDVPSNEAEGALKEMESNFRQLISKGETKFFSKLFNNQLIFQPFNNFESDLFADEIVYIRNKLLNREPGWKNVKSLLQMMKIILVQLQYDDDSKIDTIRTRLKLEEMDEKLKIYWEKPLGENLDLEFEFSCPLVESDFSCKINMADIELAENKEGKLTYCYLNDCLNLLTKLFDKTFGISRTKQSAHKYHLVLSDFIEKFFAAKINCFEIKMNNLLKDEFRNEIENDELKFFATSQKNFVNSYQNFIKQCEETCSKCKLPCVKLSKHKDQVYRDLNELKAKYDQIKKYLGECKELDKNEMEKYIASKEELDEVDKFLEMEEADYDILLSCKEAFKTILKVKSQAMTDKQSFIQYKEDLNALKIETFKINQEAFGCFLDFFHELSTKKNSILNLLEDIFASHLEPLKQLKVYEKEGLTLQENLKEFSKNLNNCFGPLLINLTSINSKQEIDIFSYKNEYFFVKNLLQNLTNSQATCMAEFKHILTYVETMKKNRNTFNKENELNIIEVDKKYANTKNSFEHLSFKFDKLNKKVENLLFSKNKTEEELQKINVEIDTNVSSIQVLEEDLRVMFANTNQRELQNEEQVLTGKVKKERAPIENFKFNTRSQAEALFQKIKTASEAYNVDANQERFLETLIAKVDSAKNSVEKILSKNSTPGLKKAKEDCDSLLVLCKNYQHLMLRLEDEYCKNNYKCDVINDEMNNETSQHAEREDISKTMVLEANRENLQNLKELSKLIYLFEECIIPNQKEMRIQTNISEFLLEFSHVFITRISSFFNINNDDLVMQINNLKDLINQKALLESFGIYPFVEELAIKNFAKICPILNNSLLKDLFNLETSRSYSIETEQNQGLLLYLSISVSIFQGYESFSDKSFNLDEILSQLKGIMSCFSKNAQSLSEKINKLNLEKESLEDKIINNFSPEIACKLSEIDEIILKDKEELTLMQHKIAYSEKLQCVIINLDKSFTNVIDKIESKMILEFEEFIPSLTNYYEEICKINIKKPEKEVREKFKAILRASKSLTQFLSEDIFFNYHNQMLNSLISEKKGKINLLKTKISESLNSHLFVIGLVTEHDQIKSKLTINQEFQKNVNFLRNNIKDLRGSLVQLNSSKEKYNKELKFSEEEYESLIKEKISIQKELDKYSSDLSKIKENRDIVQKEADIINEIYESTKQVLNMAYENKEIEDKLLESQKCIFQKREEYARIAEKFKQIERNLDAIEKKENLKTDIEEKLIFLRKNLDFKVKIGPKHAKIQELKSRKKEIKHIILTYEKKSDQLNELKQVENDLKNAEKSYQDSCDCNFDHKCYFPCSICEDNIPCKFACGHEGTHICEKDKHACGDHCEKPNCSNPCAHEFGHQSPHECTSRHECNQACNYCSNTCKFLSYEDHETHICKSDFCPKACILCSKPCASKNHNHDEEAEEIINPYEDEKMKLHLCGDAHKCEAKCQEKGVCSILISTEIKAYKTSFGEIEFEYIEAKVKQSECCLYFETGKISHEGSCKCGVDSHRCEKTCPCCNQFCMYDFGHKGKHDSKNHRNMEHCIFASVEKDAKVSVHESGIEVRQYKVGDRATPERCQESCVRKGRGHYHLKECPGGDECAGKKFSKFAKHTEEVFEPFADKKYDKVLCNMFWASFDWESPVFDEKLKTEISLCNFYCPRSHSEKQFCTNDAWHSLSVKPEHHNFACTAKHMEEPKIDGIDVCFLLDTTGSMSSAIEKSKTTIERIVNETKAQQDKGLKIKFSVVSYKDHCDGEQLVQAINFSEAKDALDFLNNQVATGGGDGAEAVVDGLYKASVQNWNKTSINFLIHILDSPPHGIEFGSSNDDYPNGCPCGKDYKDVLDDIKKKQIKYHIIKLNSSVNKMVEIFKKELNIQEINITGSLDYSDQIKNIICECSKDLEITVLNKS